MSEKKPPPEPTDFKATAQDVDVEATVTKFAGEGSPPPDVAAVEARVAPRPRVRRSPAAAPAKKQGSWFSRFWASLFG
jgi:hypothetical protein